MARIAAQLGRVGVATGWQTSLEIGLSSLRTDHPPSGTVGVTHAHFAHVFLFCFLSSHPRLLVMENNPMLLALESFVRLSGSLLLICSLVDGLARLKTLVNVLMKERLDRRSWEEFI
ncbi:hypothetical protein AVEN_123464-1 [Araneus ventricosus]|uniref:Uncharacterized protein n=1 Tax=Araneus ventricosus TaxID=182803 RepID=A0A4Y2MCG0_ARAVE|nr:hypothetical protein AVEN_123464-1 [Araneus ventricosus]